MITLELLLKFGILFTKLLLLRAKLRLFGKSLVYLSKAKVKSRILWLVRAKFEKMMQD